MTRTHRGTVTACTIAAATLLAAGCTPDEPVVQPTTEVATTSPTPSASPSSSPAPAALKPERPAAMDDDGQAGAEAAAIYFLELDSYIQATGDTDEWVAMSHSNCSFCAARAEQAAQIAAAGDVYVGGRTDVSLVETFVQDAATGIWPIDVRVHEDPSTITRSDGTVALEVKASTYDRHLELALRDGEWVVVGVAAVQGK